MYIKGLYCPFLFRLFLRWPLTPQIVRNYSFIMNIPRLISIPLAMPILALLSLLTSMTVKAEQLPKESTFGSWSLECKNQRCFLSQMLMIKAGEKIGVAGGLSVAMTDQKRTILTLRFSKDARLKSGLGIKVDGNKALRAKIIGCDKKVCETNLMMDKTLISEMEAGKTMQVVFINDKTNKQVTLPFSLNGFKPAIDELRKQK